MLPFSSITSIIPLLLLGFVYLIYFGTSVLIKQSPQPGIDENTSEKILVRANDETSPTVQYPDFRTLYNNQIDTEPDVDIHDFAFSNLCFRLPFEMSSLRLTTLHRLSAFSPRPPPVV